MRTPENRQHTRLINRMIRDGERIVDIIPYNASVDPTAFAFLPFLWKRLLDDGLLSLYSFNDPETSFGSFVTLFNDSAVWKLLFVLKDPSDLDEDGQPKITDCFGFATWTLSPMYGQMVGTIGFIFLKDYWGREATLAAARAGMRYWFETMQVPYGGDGEMTNMDVAIGYNPLANRMVQQFLPRLGWTRCLPPIPIPAYYDGGTSDTVIWFITKESFEQSEAEASAQEDSANDGQAMNAPAPSEAMDVSVVPDVPEAAE